MTDTVTINTGHPLKTVKITQKDVTNILSEGEYTVFEKSNGDSYRIKSNLIDSYEIVKGDDV